MPPSEKGRLTEREERYQNRTICGHSGAATSRMHGWLVFGYPQPPLRSGLSGVHWANEWMRHTHARVLNVQPDTTLWVSDDVPSSWVNEKRQTHIALSQLKPSDDKLYTHPVNFGFSSSAPYPHLQVQFDNPIHIPF